MTVVEVVSPGPLTTIQDLGRPGWAHIGVPRSGAADRESLRQANLLVGNGEGAAALETTLVGPRLRVHAQAVVALTGARVSATADGRAIAMDTPVSVAAGELITVGTAQVGLRTYIAFAGGIQVATSLGSAATDLLTGLGPAPLARGDLLELGDRRDQRPEIDPGPEMSPRSLASRLAAGELDDPVLRIVPGPRLDWFAADALSRLTGEPFTVSAASNRVGLRLDGPQLPHAERRELPSEGLIAGALQVAGDGQPILLLADHPTTGGYPVIAVVIDEDVGLAAQLRPGQRVRFTPAAPGPDLDRPDLDVATRDASSSLGGSH